RGLSAALDHPRVARPPLRGAGRGRPRALLAGRPLRPGLPCRYPRPVPSRGLGRPVHRRRRPQCAERVDAHPGGPAPAHPVRPGAGLHLRGRARRAPADGVDAVAAMSLASFPVLSVITWSPFVGALLIMFLARRSAPLVRGLAVAATALPLVLSIAI